MNARADLPFHGRIFVSAVAAAGIASIIHSLYRLYTFPTDYAWTILAALTLFSGSFTIKVPSVPATISVSETFVFSCVLLFGTPAATITVALDGLIMSLWSRRRDGGHVLFNTAEPAMSIWIAAEIFFRLARSGPLMGSAVDVSKLLEPILIMSACYFLLNSSLTAVAIAMETGTPVLQLWRKHFLPLSLNSFVGASVAAVIVQNTDRISFATFGIILPLLLVSYLTFKASMGRVEDANRHLADLNKLYLSTVETLAMAIDAKDQVTHGHIRRVQALAVGLAKSLGIDDPKLVRGVEAAALLHDMGKLAVPDYILNKPGKLTDAEFEKMKLHATVGAEILSTIDFPYPVVPMVRHHHEHWDGTGYPDGLSGTDIPVGARILSVVDCFDALTSDRPYRPKLSDAEALRILEERKGTTYDPAIVEAFIADYESLSRTKLSGDSQARALFDIARSSRETAKEVQMQPQTIGSNRGESAKGGDTKQFGTRH